MNLFIILFGILTIVTLFVIIISYICFRIVFYVNRKGEISSDEILVPEGEIYEPYHELMINWTKETRNYNYQDFTIKSHDGLLLHAKYFEYAPQAVCEIMFHGYRGSAERDLSGGIQRCFALGRNVLLIDQRTSCGSEGNIISFGINEHKDCLAWIDFAIQHFGSDVKLILTGISMGASTVLMAAGRPVPSNVVGVLADCGFSSAKEIIQKCAKDMHLPPPIIYPFIKLGAKIFGHFNLEEYSPMEAMKTCKIPVLFFHGQEDTFVPCYMSQKMYDVCNSPKRIVTVPNAGHGLVYLVDNPGYFQAVVEFFSKNGVPTELTSSLF